MNARQRLPTSLTPLDVALAALLRGLTLVERRAHAPLHPAADDGPALKAWPPHDVAAVDGWGLRASDLVGASSYTPVPLAKAPVWAEAGDPIPDGCDCIVDEDAVDQSGPIAQALGEAIPWQGIRRKGGALADANPIVDAWRPVGLTRSARLRVVNVPGGAITAKLIVASLRRSSIDVDFVEAAARDAASIAQVLDDSGCDLLVIVGGSGVGRTDAAVLALAERGEVIAHGLPLQPGRTAALGRIGTTQVIALPGAPDQALAVWWTLVLPTLDRLTGEGRGTMTKPLARKIASSVGIAEIVLLEEKDGAWLPLSVGDLPFTAIAQAHAWLVVPGPSEGYAAGTPVNAYVLRERV
jgi:molybdopterin molybdotransferase